MVDGMVERIKNDIPAVSESNTEKVRQRVRAYSLIGMLGLGIAAGAIGEKEFGHNVERIVKVTPHIQVEQSNSVTKVSIDVRAGLKAKHDTLLYDARKSLRDALKDGHFTKEKQKEVLYSYDKVLDNSIALTCASGKRPSKDLWGDADIGTWDYMVVKLLLDKDSRQLQDIFRHAGYGEKLVVD